MMLPKELSMAILNGHQFASNNTAYFINHDSLIRLILIKTNKKRVLSTKYYYSVARSRINMLSFSEKF